MTTTGPERPDATTDPSHPQRTPDNTTNSDDQPAVINAYRTKYKIAGNDPRPLGPEPPAGAFRQRLDRRHAAQAALHAVNTADGRDIDKLVQQLRDAQDLSAERNDQTLNRDT